MQNCSLLSLFWGFLANPFAEAQIGSIPPTLDPTVSASATATAGPNAGTHARPADPPDVLLRVLELHVGKIELDVDDMQAEVNLAAEIAGLVEINAGVQVGVRKVNITIADVDAELELDIVSRTLKSLDLNPLLVNVLDTATGLATTVVGAVDGALGSITKEGGGATVHVMIDNLGKIVEEADGGSATITFLDEGLTQRTYSYPPLKAMVNIVTSAAGNVV
ncbi:hypothetical protein PG994_009515 [Apiospora phragmitis]|uniref:Uncharacterized protein n=1 Tax=Apiospora phragmitis TaxID=2905665 RepID=A0ABR1U6B4_9PEZI